jgi:uncharacterized protein (TIGR00106 family)
MACGGVGWMERKEVGMSVIVDLSIFPLDKGESVSRYVARVLNIISTCGLMYKLGPMGTSIEGEWEEVMEVVSRCLKELQRDCERVYMTMKVDYRKGPGGRLEEKVGSVREKLDTPPHKPI